LPQTKLLAIELDELLIRLSAASASDEIGRFQLSLHGCEWIRWCFREVLPEHARVLAVQAMDRASGWGQWAELMPYLAEQLVLLFLSRLDVEHGATYFGELKPRPVLLLVAPRTCMRRSTMGVGSGRSATVLPAKRLLQLSHALVYFHRYKKWPSSPVKRKELAAKLHTEEQVVSNFFDGTKALTERVYSNLIWRPLCKNVAEVGEPFPYPVPLLLGTVLIQAGFLKLRQKYDQVTAPLDDATYRAWWQWHREHWASPLPEGKTDWPSWVQ